MKVSYVCTNYNNTCETLEAVRSLSENSERKHTVVVVDNGSDEENVYALKKLAREFPNVELILNNENVGYFRGLNLGIRRLKGIQSDVDLLVVGNNDLMFPADFTECIDRNESLFELHAVVSPDIITLDGVHQNPHVVRKIGAFRESIYDLYYANYYLGIAIRHIANLTHAFTDRPDEMQHELAQEIYQGYGACYLLGPLFFEQFDELWAPTFMLHEEYFLSKQLSDKGMRIYYEPSIKVLHRCKGAIGKVPGRKAWELGRDAHRVYRHYVAIV